MPRYDTEFPCLEKIKQERIACLAIIAEIFPSCVSSSSHTTLPRILNACQVLFWTNSHYHRQLLIKHYENITSNIPHLNLGSQLFISAVCSPIQYFAAIKGEGTFETLCTPSGNPQVLIKTQVLLLSPMCRERGRHTAFL